MITLRKSMLTIAALSLLSSAAARQAGAETFAQRHPRRAEVLRRDRKEINKNNAAAVAGKITDKQARKLDKEDRSIRAQEQADAKADGGHITKAEQHKLNREENSVNRQRAQDEKNDAAATSPAAT